MSNALFVLYLIVEIAAFVAVGKWIGFGWAILALIGLFAVGVVAAAWEMRRLTARAMDDAISAREAMGGTGTGAADARASRASASPADREKQARKALASAGTLVGGLAVLMGGRVLLALAGFVTGVLGLLLILPPTRWLIRSVGGASLSSWFQRTGSRSMFVVQRYGVRFGDDGAEVIDHDDPSAPSGPGSPFGSSFTTADDSAPRRLDRGTGERITFDVPEDLSELDEWAREDEKLRGRPAGGVSDDMVIDEEPADDDDRADDGDDRDDRREPRG
ncbi:FxsA family protein [Corynebacterium freneyi]